MFRLMGTKLLLLFYLSLLLNTVLIVWLAFLSSQTDQLHGPSYGRNRIKSLDFGHHGVLGVPDPLADMDEEECMISGLNESSTSVLKTLGDFSNTIRSIIPPPQNYLPEYRNPCWHMNIQFSQSINKLLRGSGNLTDLVALKVASTLFQTQTKTLVCIPSVYFIGFPRSGSTQLYMTMIKHPQLLGGSNKEPHWWTKSQFDGNFPHNILTVVRYLSHFHEASQNLLEHPDSLLIDGSQSTIWDTRTTKNLCALPHLITSIVPDAKFIVLIRDPVQRLMSDTKYLCEEMWNVRKNGSIPKGYLANETEVFLESAQLEIESFKKCLLTDDLSTCTHHALNADNGIMQDKCGRVRLGISLYHVHVRRWLNVIPRERFLFLRTDDLDSNPLEVLQKVWRFLGLPEQNVEDLTDILHKHLHSSQHQSLITEQDERFQFLSQFFQPHNEKLAELLQDDRFSWLDDI